MSHKSNVSLAEQLKNTLTAKLAIGRSKAKDKKNGIDCRDYIYSWNTYKTYYKQGKAFIKFCKSKGYKCRTLADCRPYCDSWLADGAARGLSPFTLKLYVATLSKIYSETSDSFIETPARLRKNVFRSRRKAVRDSNFSIEKHADLLEFAASTSLRRAELKALRGNKLIQDADGNYRILVNSASKGGRPREALIIGNVQKIVDMMRAAGDGKVFPDGIPSAIDIHHQRAQYACDLYRHLMKTEGIPDDRNDRYICRRDMRSRVYSKKLMAVVSENLGHSRIGVIAQAYLYQLTAAELK